MGFWGTIGRVGADLATGGGYEGYKYLNDKAAQGYNTAAQGAGQAYQQGSQFAQTQWDRQMQGLQGAQGAYTPAQNWFNSTYGNQGYGPMEQYYQQNASQFQQQGAQQGAYSQFHNWMADPANNSTQMGATRANQYMSGPTASSQAYSAASPYLTSFQGPTNGADQYRQNQQSYDTSGASENWYANNSGSYTQPSQSQALYGGMAPQLQGPSRSESLQVNGPSYLQDALGGYQNFANGQSLGAQDANVNKSYITGANQLSDYYQSQAGQLSGPGAYEQFVSQDINGTNPALQQAQSEAAASLNQDLARRGHFDSGGADVALGKLYGNFAAQDYENRAQRAQQAQQMQLQRIGTGGSLAGQASGTDISRGTALSGIDQSNEAAQLARQQFGLSATGQASQEDLSGQQLALQSAQQSDAAKLARLAGLQSMAGQSDQMRMQGLQLGQNAANDAQSQELARLMGGQNAANSVDQTSLASSQQQLARLLANFQMGQGTDQSNMDRANALFSQGQAIDQSQLQRYAMQTGMAQNLDSNTLAKLLGQGTMANDAQGAEQSRLNSAMGAQMGISSGLADQYARFYGQGGQLSGSAENDALSALLAQYGYQGQGQLAQAQLPFQIGGLAIDGYKASQGAR